MQQSASLAVEHAWLDDHQQTRKMVLVPGTTISFMSSVKMAIFHTRFLLTKSTCDALDMFEYYYTVNLSLGQ
uniref:Uncharacterized protein n=1 Tax=Oryza meridionalis TaxID=40149 RepID=A0A0E0CN89_9ORYZ